MSDSTIILKLWLVSGTDKAYLFSTTPAERRDGFKVWIPLSQIKGMTRSLGKWKECDVTLTEFIAQKKGLL